MTLWDGLGDSLPEIDDVTLTVVLSLDVVVWLVDAVVETVSLTLVVSD